MFELSSGSDEFCKILKIAILVCLVSILRHNSTNTTKKAARPETVTDFDGNKLDDCSRTELSFEGNLQHTSSTINLYQLSQRKRWFDTNERMSVGDSGSLRRTGVSRNPRHHEMSTLCAARALADSVPSRAGPHPRGRMLHSPAPRRVAIAWTKRDISSRRRTRAPARLYRVKRVGEGAATNSPPSRKGSVAPLPL